jgi:hypothetical protein
LTDGGTTTASKHQQYATVLKTLLELERQTRKSSTTVAPGRITTTVDEFLRVPRSGSGYTSGLYIAGRLIVRHDIEVTDIQQVAVEREPERELLLWVLQRNVEDDPPELSDEAFTYCIERSEWRRLLCQAGANTSAENGLSDNQLETLAVEAATADTFLPLVRQLRRRGLTDAGCDALSGHFEAKVDRCETAELLQEVDEYDFLDQFTERLAATIGGWKPEDGPAELETLAEFGCEYEQYNEVLLAVTRWLRASDWETVPDQHCSLVARGIEALLHREGPGASEALSLYRRHIYPADALHGLGTTLYQTAKAADATDVTDDILRVYDQEGEMERETAADTKLAAEVAEENDRWDEAFRLWAEVIDEEPRRDAISRAIETRLVVLDLTEAERLIEQLEAEGRHLYASAYELRVAAARGDQRTVVDIAQREGAIFDVDAPLRSAVTEAYTQAIAELTRWKTLESFLDGRAELETDLHRFYLRLARLMRFASGDDSSLDGVEAVDLAEQLLTSPLDTEQLRLVLNLDVVGQLDGELRSSYPEAHDRMDVIRGLLEILVSLHAEQLIDALREAGVDTDDFERRLAETAPGQGGRQLLSELDREARRAGVTTTNGRN